MGTTLSQVPVVFLSYDEPYADAHWYRLAAQVPEAKRVHGVKGFDAAHKAAADAAGDCEEFITVDADNIVMDDFWMTYLDSRPQHLEGNVLSWRSYNVVNGLQYGNGGLKLWKTEFVRNMVTHERAKTDTGQTVVDFCWDDRYTQLRQVYSVTDFSSSAFHCWRAGLREGVKMPLRDGVPPDDPSKLREHAYPSCLDRLTQWSAVGRGKGFGGWAMYGTIQGLYQSHVSKVLPLDAIMDYELLKAMWDSLGVDPLDPPADPFTDSRLRISVDQMIKGIHEATGLYLPVLGPVQAEHVRQWMMPTRTQDPYEEDSWHRIHW